MDHTTDLMNRGPNAQPFDWEGCEFKCAFPDCGEASHDAEDLAKCETCGSRYCANHLISCEGLLNCETCFRCDSPGCGKPAVGLCDNCGDFGCANHLRERCMYDRDTGHSEQQDTCGRCAA